MINIPNKHILTHNLLLEKQWYSKLRYMFSFLCLCWDQLPSEGLFWGWGGGLYKLNLLEIKGWIAILNLSCLGLNAPILVIVVYH